MPDLHHAFGDIVRDHRKQAGRSQEALADRAGIHRTYVSAVELGKVRLGLEAAKRLADGLNTSFAGLIAEAEALLSSAVSEDVG